LLSLTLLFSCSEKRQPVEKIIIGKIWTANPQQPWAEAMAINGDSIAAVGSEEEILKWKGDKVVLDQNIFKISTEKIRDTRIVNTVVGGKVVFNQE